MGFDMSLAGFPEETRQKFIQQRAERGFCDSDLMDFDSYLLDIIIGGLKAIAAKEDCGTPSYMSEEQWREFLTRLAARFQKAANQKEDLETLDDAQHTLDSAFKYLSTHLFELWL